MVAFVTADEATDDGTRKRVPKGTAFFVGVPVDGEAQLVYVVTARHVIEEARAAGWASLRVNGTDGGFEDIPMECFEWISSSRADVAVAKWPFPPSVWDIAVFPVRFLLTQEEIARREIGPGDDLFFVSLFTQHPGRARAEPIVRFGNIALMPGEPIRMLQPGGGIAKFVAYLAEARSWGGSSGSPCFVYFPAHRFGSVWIPVIDEPGPMTDEKFAEATNPRLLGLVQGHFNIDQDVSFAHDSASHLVKMNAGVAVVAPAVDIIEVLMDESFEEERRVAAEAIKKDRQPGAN